MKKRLCWNQRTKTLILLAVAVFYLAGVAVWGLVGRESALVTDFSRKNLTPSLSYLFGTDWLGRDMLARTVTGLSISIIIGVCAAAVSAVIAGLLGVAAATLGKKVDAVITWLIDLIMGIPHILLLI